MASTTAHADVGVLARLGARTVAGRVDESLVRPAQKVTSPAVERPATRRMKLGALRENLSGKLPEEEDVVPPKRRVNEAAPVRVLTAASGASLAAQVLGARKS